MKQFEAWAGFKGRLWKEEVNTRDFIQNNYTPYDGDASFLADATEATDKLWEELQELNKQARAKGGVLDMDTDIVSSITSHGPGYLDKDLEKVVGLQTDKPLKRAFMPYGGIRMARGVLRDVRIYSQAQSCTRSSLYITRPTIRAYLMHIHQRFVLHVRTRSLLVCRIPTAVAVS
mgnify:CR=1 FL=1